MQLRDIGAAAIFIKSKVDLLEHVRTDTGELGKIVGNNVGFCCPFHKENDPSCMVNTKGELREYFFYCFGCKRGGSVLDWVMYTEGCDAAEAIQILAERYALDIGVFIDDNMDPRLAFYNRVYAAVVSACSDALFDTESALTYMRDIRKLNVEVLREFSIGYVKDLPWLHRRIEEVMNEQVNYEDLQKLDLVNPNVWVDAVVFPVMDGSGRPVQFYTRPFGEGAAKYISTSHSTPLFHEDAVYGLHRARKVLRESGGVLYMVEGQIDMLQMVACGFKNTVATCGASRYLNKELIGTFQRYKTNEVVAIPDGDDAGRRTCLDICDRFTDFGDIFVKIGIPAFGDPDEILKEFGAAGMQTYIDKAIHPVQYFVDSTWKGTQDLTGGLKFLDEVCKYINKFSVTFRELAAKLIEEKYGIVSAMDYFIAHSANPRDIHDKDAEGAILRAMVSDRELAYVIRQELSGDEFYVQNNHDIWRAINDCINKYGVINNDVLITNLKKPLGIYWEGIRRTGLDIDYCIAVVKELYVRRSATKSASKLMVEAVDLDKDVDVIMAEHRAAIVTISDKRGNLAGSCVEMVADDFADLYIERATSGKTIIGVPLGKRWDILNRAWSGLELGYVHVISAPTGVGKTSVAVNWFTDMISPEEGYYDPTPALFISAEMTQQDIWCRCLSTRTGLSNTMIRIGGYPQGSPEWEKMMVGYTALRQAPGYIVVPTTFTVGEILGIIEYHRLKYGVRHVFIDYIQLIRSEGRNKKWEVLDEASTRLQNRAMHGKDPICIVELAQQNVRGSEDGFGSAETMGGAYKISQDAAKLVIFNKKKEDEIFRHGIKRGNILMNISKVRMGPSNILVDTYYDNDIKIGSLRAGEAALWDQEFRMPELKQFAAGTGSLM